MTPEFESRLRTFRLAVLVLGVLGLLACFIGGFFQTPQFYRGYLFGYLVWLGLAMGCMTIAMIHYLTGGRWGYPVRRFLEAGFSTLPLMLVLFVPIFIGLHDLYPWAHPAIVSGDTVLEKRSPYLNIPWFIGRTIFWFVLWIIIAWLLRRWSLSQDEQPQNIRPSIRLRTLSGPGLVVFALSGTFAYVDWVMSLERDWYSQIFGIEILAGQVLVAFAFIAILVMIFGEQPDFSGAVGTVTYHQIGNLMLAFVLFWTYASFAQLLIIYSGNLPHEISWYLHRMAGSWKIIVAALAFFHFFFPFTLLLLRTLKKNPRSLGALAIVLLLIHMVEVFWYVAPSFHPFGFRVTWFDFAAPIGVGGIWLSAFFGLLARAPLMPANDPRMVEELKYGTG